MSVLLALTLFNSISFLAYGASCLFAAKMKSEFIRFGLANYQRIITGVAQLLGGAGLIIGYFVDLRISILSTVGLSILMLAGFVTRLKIKDSLAQTLPSFVFMLLNIILAFLLYNQL